MAKKKPVQPSAIFDLVRHFSDDEFQQFGDLLATINEGTWKSADDEQRRLWIRALGQAIDLTKKNLDTLISTRKKLPRRTPDDDKTADTAADYEKLRKAIANGTAYGMKESLARQRKLSPQAFNNRLKRYADRTDKPRLKISRTKKL